MPPAARLLIVIGLVAIVFALVLWKAPGLLSWFGKLPGDLRYEGESSRVYVPITSMIVVSLLLTLVVNVVGWLLRRGG